MPDTTTPLTCEDLKAREDSEGQVKLYIRLTFQEMRKGLDTFWEYIEEKYFKDALMVGASDPRFIELDGPEHVICLIETGWVPLED